ncbi:MAG: Ig domain-containing protein [Oscillibacter sp.]|nr:Ig domain-containing protein [Oscillibacter sp.]
MEKNYQDSQPRTQGGGGSAFITFLLVLIILLLSGLLVYLRYGDLIMNRLYQFTDGKIGAETGVTSLPGRDTKPPVEDTDGGASDEPPGDVPSDAMPDGGTSDETPDDAAPPEPEPEPEPTPAVMDYAAAKALPDGIALSTHDFTLRTLGESATIRVKGGSEGPFTWVSQNPSVASVDENGKVTAVSHGTVNIIVTDGVKKGLCVARMITGAASTAAKLNTTDFTRTVDEGEYHLKVSGVEADIRWTSDNPSVATVDADGFVTPVGKGQARIRASWDGGYLICVVRVPG